MNTIKKIRIWLGSYILKNKLKKTSRIKQTHSLSTACTIDILFDASKTNDYKIIKLFVDRLIRNNKKVRAMGYVNAKVIPQQMYLINNFDFFCRKDKNLLNIPKSEIIHDFIKTKSDILIDLSLSELFCLNYIASLKNSTFKIGRFTNASSYMDMMIDIKENKTVEFLIDQITHYLSVIKRKERIENE